MFASGTGQAALLLSAAFTRNSLGFNFSHAFFFFVFMFQSICLQKQVNIYIPVSNGVTHVTWCNLPERNLVEGGTKGKQRSCR